MSKLTQKTIEKYALYVSECSKNYEFRANRRNGYIAIDIYIKGGALVDTPFCGTTREVFYFLWGMLEGARYKDMLKPF